MQDTWPAPGLPAGRKCCARPFPFERCGVQQVILSASNLPVLEQQVTERGVRPYFDRLLGLDNIYARSKVEVGLAYLTELSSAVPYRRRLL